MSKSDNPPQQPHVLEELNPHVGFIWIVFVSLSVCALVNLQLPVLINNSADPNGRAV